MLRFITAMMVSWMMIPVAFAQSYDVDVDFDLDDFKSDYLADTEFMNGEGDRLTLRQFRGKPVVLTFWGTWCPPCIAEMPYLDSLAGELEGKVHFISLAQAKDGKADPYSLMKDVKAFMKKKKVENLEVYVDIFSQLFSMFEIGNSIPSTMVFDANGEEVLRHLGALGWESKDFEKRVKEIAGVKG